MDARDIEVWCCEVESQIVKSLPVAPGSAMAVARWSGTSSEVAAEGEYTYGQSA